MRNKQQQLGDWKPSQHLIHDTEEPGKPVSMWHISGPSRHDIHLNQGSTNFPKT